MARLNSLNPERVFNYFEQICAIPRGSENMKAISQYCIDFAKNHSLEAVRDEADNVIIYKPATTGYESSEPIILQGHLDMVCQKTDDCNIDFDKDGLDVYIDGDFVKAKGTSLGADNGIAVAMILAILESSDISHPAIEAVFTTDEEIGMCGAMVLDMKKLNAKRMINLDAEEDDILTVSCAGGSDFRITMPIEFENKKGNRIDISLKGLRGGHSGVEINSNRVNANKLAARFLNHMKNICEFELISINGGDKGNAIPNSCQISLCTDNASSFETAANDCLAVIKAEISDREPQFSYDICISENTDCKAIKSDIKDKLIFGLLIVPNGVCEMSSEIENLVESSQNLGILKTTDSEIILHFTLRSNKQSALNFLEDRMKAFADSLNSEYEASGHYPPWEFNSNSQLQNIYKECFVQEFGTIPKVEAIHAGLECGIFSSAIDGLDCIAMGPSLFDVHTVNERLSITSTEKIYNLLIKILKSCR